MRSHRSAISVVTVFSFVIGLGLATAARAHQMHAAHNHGEAQTPAVKRSMMQLNIPAVALIRDDGVKTNLRAELEDNHPVYVNFIFTSCQSVCPVMSQIFAHLQDRLGPGRGSVRMMSVSIDPEHDTPARLATYARQFDAGSQWRFYTGTNESSLAVQKAFAVLGRDKMNHPVATFFRAAPGRAWVRLDGFASAEQLESELRAAGN